MSEQSEHLDARIAGVEAVQASHGQQIPSVFESISGLRAEHAKETEDLRKLILENKSTNWGALATLFGGLAIVAGLIGAIIGVMIDNVDKKSSDKIEILGFEMMNIERRMDARMREAKDSINDDINESEARALEIIKQAKADRIREMKELKKAINEPLEERIIAVEDMSNKQYEHLMEVDRSRKTQP